LAAVQPLGQQPSEETQLVMVAVCTQATLQLVTVPISRIGLQALLEAGQEVGQLPSQSSPVSTVLFPQLAEQSLSLALLQPGAQQPSPPRHWTMEAWEQRRLQLVADPVRPSMVQALSSSQLAGQLPSQLSPGSTWLSPQLAEQSLSFPLLQPAGQQPSELAQVVTFWWMHWRLQLLAAPVRVSMVQALLSSQLAGQLPSQVSLGSTRPLPQLAEQSLSLAFVQPEGQQPSPLVQEVTDWWLQAKLQVEAAPVEASRVQALPSSQLVGQSPSQVSLTSRRPLPQLAEQSLSVALVQPMGQQPSAETQLSLL